MFNKLYIAWLHLLRYMVAMDHYRYTKIGDTLAAANTYNIMVTYDRQIQDRTFADTVSRRVL